MLQPTPQAGFKKKRKAVTKCIDFKHKITVVLSGTNSKQTKHNLWASRGTQTKQVISKKRTLAGNNLQ